MNYNELVKTIIGPKLTSLGFTITKEGKGIIEFNHEDFVLVFSYDYDLSYEVAFTIVYKEDKSFFSQHELEDYFYKTKSNIKAIQIVDENTMINWLQDVNRFINENMNTIINNHYKVKEGLEIIRNYRANVYENERNIKFLTENVEKYWSVKDYSGLVKFIENYKGNYSEVINKKYMFALKMIKGK